VAAAVAVDGEARVLWRAESKVIRDARWAFDCEKASETDGEED